MKLFRTMPRMTVIKIEGAQNRHVNYLYNKVMPIERKYAAGARYDLQPRDVQLNIWGRKSLFGAKRALRKLHINFTQLQAS